MSFFGGAPVTVLSQSITLTDAQIKALPTTPVVIVPATETLNYSGFPATLFLPIAFVVSLDSQAGAYTNVDGAAFMVLAIGSDWSANALEADQSQMVSIQNADRTAGIANSYHRELSSSMIAPLRVQNDGLFDNALAIAMNNAAGDLTGGNAANSMKVSVLYTIIDV